MIKEMAAGRQQSYEFGNWTLRCGVYITFRSPLRCVGAQPTVVPSIGYCVKHPVAAGDRPQRDMRASNENMDIDKEKEKDRMGK